MGKKIELLVTDHQNKPDLGADKFGEWADRDGLTMVLGGSNTGVSIAMATIAKEKKIPILRHRRGRRVANRQGLYALLRALCIRYHGAWEWNGDDHSEARRKVLVFVTADYAFGTQLQDAAANVVAADGGKVLGSVRVPLGTPDFSSFVLQAKDSGAQVLGLANAGEGLHQLTQDR